MGRPLLGGVNIEYDIKGRRRGVGIDKTPYFGKSNMGMESNMGMRDKTTQFG